MVCTANRIGSLCLALSYFVEILHVHIINLSLHGIRTSSYWVWLNLIFSTNHSSPREAQHLCNYCTWPFRNRLKIYCLPKEIPKLGGIKIKHLWMHHSFKCQSLLFQYWELFPHPNWPSKRLNPWVSKHPRPWHNQNRMILLQGLSGLLDCSSSLRGRLY